MYKRTLWKRCGLGLLLLLSGCQGSEEKNASKPAEALPLVGVSTTLPAQPASSSSASLLEPATSAQAPEANEGLQPSLAQVLPNGSSSSESFSPLPPVPHLIAEPQQRQIASIWNLVSLPVTQITQIETVFARFPAMRSLWRWESQTRTWFVYPRRTNYPLLTEVSPDEGYWMEAASAFDLAGTGRTPNAYQLQPGWNLIGYSHSASTIHLSAFLAQSTQWKDRCGAWSVLSAWAWDGRTWNVYFPDPARLTTFNQQNKSNYTALNTLTPGSALWVDVIRDNELRPAAGCPQISAGAQHTCALTSQGLVKCWGAGDQGQLGTGEASDATTPMLVSGVSNTIQIGTGEAHTCALSNSGQVRCWGRATEGQLGNGTTTNQIRPVLVDLTNIVQISLGGFHTCALRLGGQVLCWGRSSEGQLGLGRDPGLQTIPAPVSNLSNIIQISAGAFHTCALLSGGTIQCWGRGAEGQLGNAQDAFTSEDLVYQENAPVGVAGVSGAVQLSSGDFHSCALLNGGEVRCWGRGAEGQLGNGKDSQTTGRTTYHETTAVSVKTLSRAIHISAGQQHTCALLNNAQVFCWGAGSAGQLGDGTTLARNLPVMVSPLARTVQVSAGSQHTCALLSDSSVSCWGSASRGRLGNGRELSEVNTSGQVTPAIVSNLGTVQQVSAGNDFSCGVLSGGGLACWGKGDQGQLGNGSSSDASEARLVSHLNGVTQVSAGGQHACALTSAGTVACWGRGTEGQLGNGSEYSQSFPVTVHQLTNPLQVTTGSSHSCALSSGRRVFCWGLGTQGQLGNEALTSSSVPLAVSGLTQAQQIEAGSQHTCALHAANVRCWGLGNFGQLGQVGITQAFTPITVVGLAGTATQISAGDEHTCALIGTLVQCWGRNQRSQLGQPNNIASLPTPTTITGLNGAPIQISAGGQHTCALLSTRQVQCWGAGRAGQLGEGTQDSATPLFVRNLQTAIALSAGQQHTCALLQDSTVRCWGAETSGQLGQSQDFFTQPISVYHLITDETF